MVINNVCYIVDCLVFGCYLFLEMTPSTKQAGSAAISQENYCVKTFIFDCDMVKLPLHQDGWWYRHGVSAPYTRVNRIGFDCVHPKCHLNRSLAQWSLDTIIERIKTSKKHQLMPLIRERPHDSKSWKQVKCAWHSLRPQITLRWTGATAELIYPTA